MTNAQTDRKRTAQNVSEGAHSEWKEKKPSAHRHTHTHSHQAFKKKK